jgi:hypothetical protein
MGASEETGAEGRAEIGDVGSRKRAAGWEAGEMGLRVGVLRMEGKFFKPRRGRGVGM